MKKVKIEIIILENKEEYYKEYCDVYCSNNFKFLAIPIIFSPEDFDHIFTEPSASSNERKFSARRAKKMMFIKAMITGCVYIELGFEHDSGNFAVFSRDLDCVMYLKPWPSTKSLRLMTFFDFGKNFTKMYNKQKKKCEELTIKKFKEAVVSRLTTSRDVDS